MSRGRISSARPLAENEQNSVQLWRSLVDTLRLLPSIRPATGHLSEEEHTRELKNAAGEIKTIDDALDKVSQLITIRKEAASRIHHPAPVEIAPHPTTPLSAAMAAPHKRKRPQSYSASPAPVDATASPLPRSVSGVSKRDSFADQLPLQAGRKVAFRQPAAKGSGDDEEWILATIKRCIGGDRLRYEVQDDDDVNNSFNTTLRSIIPLPDPDAPPHLSSHPSNLEDFPKGSTVLALYPDTTSFYSATVIAAPIPGTGMGLGIRNGTGRPDPGAKKENYRLAFVDDDHKVQDVHKYFVVMQ